MKTNTKIIGLTVLVIGFFILPAVVMSQEELMDSNAFVIVDSWQDNGNLTDGKVKLVLRVASSLTSAPTFTFSGNQDMYYVDKVVVDLSKPDNLENKIINSITAAEILYGRNLTNFTLLPNGRSIQSNGSYNRYDLVASWDVSITKTNIGTTAVNIYTTANSDGKSTLIDTTGLTEGKVLVNWNKIGTGTQSIRAIDNTSAILFTMNVVSGNNEMFFTIPVGQQNTIRKYRLQASSTVSGDDPVFESANIIMK